MEWLIALTLTALPSPVQVICPPDCERELLGVARDSRSGERLPYLRFVLKAPGLKVPGLKVPGAQRWELITADEDGHFRTRGRYPEGRLVMRTAENGGLGPEAAVEFRHGVDCDRDESSPRREVSFSVGQRLEIDAAVPPGYLLADLRVVPLLPGQHPASVLTTSAAKLRRDRREAPTWVRFTRRQAALALPSVPLFIFTADGWFGAVSERGQVQARLEPLGHVDLGLELDRGTSGQPPFAADSLRVRCEHLDRQAAGPFFLPVPVGFGAGERIRIPHLRPGRWRFSLVPASQDWGLEGDGTVGMAAASVELDLDAGINSSLRSRIDFEWGQHLDTGVLTMRVVEPHGDLIFATVKRVGGGRSFSLWTAPVMCGNGIDALFHRVEVDGASVLEARLGPLAMGDYELHLRSDRALTGPERARPGETVVFTLGPAHVNDR